MGLNDVMARLKEPKASQPTPTEQGLVLSRLQLDRITEALRIAKRSREAELKTVKRTKTERRKSGNPIKREENQIATLCKQITDYNQLILLFRNETSRLQSKSIR